MHSLSENDTKALAALATYQYLSPSQMERLKVGKSREIIRQHTLARLARGRSPLVRFQEFGVIAGIGRLERIYFLSDSGARTVADMQGCDLSEIAYPKYGLRFRNDYFHRKAFIDFHIWLRQWIDAQNGSELEFFHPYFVKDRNRRSINQFKFKPTDYRSPFDRLTIEPDGVFRFENGDTATLAAVEIHRKADSKAIAKQLDQHVDAMSSEQNLIPERFQHEAPCYVLSVHEHVGSFKSVQKRLAAMEDFREFLPFFHFNIMENIRKNAGQWILADGKKSPLFQQNP